MGLLDMLKVFNQFRLAHIKTNKEKDMKTARIGFEGHYKQLVVGLDDTQWVFREQMQSALSGWDSFEVLIMNVRGNGGLEVWVDGYQLDELDWVYMALEDVYKRVLDIYLFELETGLS